MGEFSFMSDIKPNPEKDPSDWTTGDEPMTGPQTSYLKTLCQEANVEFPDGLTKAQASVRIEELQRMTGRGAAGEAAGMPPENQRPSEAAGEDFR